MKLLALGLRSERFAEPVRLPFDDVTAILGTNDAGKTTSLIAIHEALAMLQGQPRATARFVPVGVAGVTLELSRADFSELLSRACEAVAEGIPCRFQMGDLDVAMRGGSALLRNFDRHVDNGREEWVRFVRAHAGLGAARWDSIFLLLQESSVLGLEGASDSRGWSAWWCLPPADQLDASVIALLRDLNVLDDEPLPPGPLPLIPAHPDDFGHRGLPHPLWVPQPDDAISHGFGDSTESLRVAVLHAASGFGDVANEQVWKRNALAETLPAKPELTGRLAMVITAMARRLLPSFISAHYGLFARVGDDGDEAPLGIDVAARRSGRQFGLEDLAEGYRLWTQLALLEAFSLAERSADAVRRAWDAEDVEILEAVEEIILAVSTEWNPADDEKIGHLVEELARMWVYGRELVDDTGREEQLSTIASLAGTTLYVIDEPEQHLHPSLQREAARWLLDTMRTRRAQCVIATHSTAFLSLGKGAVFARASRREDGPINIGPFDPYALRATDEAAITLGLDRGELLSLYRAMLFVEGVLDKAVLESLFPDRIRQVGLLIAPLHGVKGVRAVPEAETLFQMTRANIAVLVDNDPHETIPQLWTKSDEELENPGKTLEVVQVAKLILAARRSGVHVEPFSIRTQDILGLLDSESVVAALDSQEISAPHRYPGWVEAHAEHTERGAGRSSWDFLAEEFGIPKDRDFFGAAAADMYRRGVIPSELTDLFDGLERLALSRS